MLVKTDHAKKLKSVFVNNNKRLTVEIVNMLLNLNAIVSLIEMSADIDIKINKKFLRFDEFYIKCNCDMMSFKNN